MSQTMKHLVGTGQSINQVENISAVKVKFINNQEGNRYHIKYYITKKTADLV